ncbi:hypothetical protein FA95DRAFT_1505616, partial [Auriscalpium vulgare]
METSPGWESAIQGAYHSDPFFAKIVKSPGEFASFTNKDDKWYSQSRVGNTVLCVPNALLRKRKVREIITDTAHRTLGHLGAHKTSEYIRRWFWW